MVYYCLLSTAFSLRIPFNKRFLSIDGSLYHLLGVLDKLKSFLIRSFSQKGKEL